MDIEQPAELIAYLRAQRRIAADESPRIRVLHGGVSNRTVLVERASGEAWVLKQALEKLRVAAEWHASPERIHREAAGIRALGALTGGGAVPALIFEDREHHVLAMEAVPQPHENWKELLLAGRVDADLVRQFGALLGGIHSGSHQRRAELEREFADRSFFESLRIEPYYQRSAERCAAAAPFLGALIADTRANLLTVVHGDYSPKNILVRDERLVLLDHEVIHWGDPAFDLGFASTHLLSKANHLAASRQAFGEATAVFWSSYRDTAGTLADATLEARAVRHTLGCLLARVDGRSPLDYLTEPERARQREAVLALMARPPAAMPELAERFVASIEGRSHARH
jgi:aminoglycoside phosphotransferase (APT) family kinase protein